MKKVLWIIGGLIVLAAIGIMMNGTAPGAQSTALTADQADEVKTAHSKHGWSQPIAVEVRSGVVVAEYEVPTDMIGSKAKFAEDRLLAIREELLPDGLTAYRVNVNGPSPGAGLVRRYGSATFLGSGSVTWATP